MNLQDYGAGWSESQPAGAGGREQRDIGIKVEASQSSCRHPEQELEK
jgi:hypothetical protein